MFFLLMMYAEVTVNPLLIPYLKYAPLPLSLLIPTFPPLFLKMIDCVH